MCFKSSLLNKYEQKCLISKAHQLECDGAHIVPKHVCQHLNYPDLITDAKNGLLLFSGFHRSFDHYNWTFDPYQVKFLDNSEWCWMPIIVNPQYKQHFIFQYQNQFVKINKASLPFLWLDYQIFLSHNFTQNLDGLTQKQKNKVLTDNYYNLMQTQQFKQLCKNPLLIKQFITSSEQQLILAHRYGLDNRKYQVLNLHQAWSNRIWLNSDQLPNKLIKLYHQRINLLTDPSYKSIKYRKSLKSQYNLRNTKKSLIIKQR